MTVTEVERLNRSGLGEMYGPHRLLFEHERWYIEMCFNRWVKPCVYFDINRYSKVPPLIRMENDNPGFLSSRGDNFLFKNIFFLKSVKNSESWKKWNFDLSKFLRFFGNLWDLLDFPLRFLYRRKGKSRKSHFSKKI